MLAAAALLEGAAAAGVANNAWAGAGFPALVGVELTEVVAEPFIGREGCSCRSSLTGKL